MNYAIREFLEFFGGGARAAQALGVSQATVSRWKHGQAIPVQQAKKIEAVTMGRYTAARLLGLDHKAI